MELESKKSGFYGTVLRIPVYIHLMTVARQSASSLATPPEILMGLHLSFRKFPVDTQSRKVETHKEYYEH